MPILSYSILRHRNLCFFPFQSCNESRWRIDHRLEGSGNPPPEGPGPLVHSLPQTGLGGPAPVPLMDLVLTRPPLQQKTSSGPRQPSFSSTSSALSANMASQQEVHSANTASQQTNSASQQASPASQNNPARTPLISAEVLNDVVHNVMQATLRSYGLLPTSSPTPSAASTASVAASPGTNTMNTVTSLPLTPQTFSNANISSSTPVPPIPHTGTPQMPGLLPTNSTGSPCQPLPASSGGTSNVPEGRAGGYPKAPSSSPRGSNNKMSFVITRQSGQSSLQSTPTSAQQRPQVLAPLVQKEVNNGRFLGPFTAPPLSPMRINPIGFVPKKTPNQYRLIVDKSSVSYPVIQDAI